MAPLGFNRKSSPQHFDVIVLQITDYFQEQAYLLKWLKITISKNVGVNDDRHLEVIIEFSIETDS